MSVHVPCWVAESVLTECHHVISALSRSGPLLPARWSRRQGHRPLGPCRPQSGHTWLRPVRRPLWLCVRPPAPSVSSLPLAPQGNGSPCSYSDSWVKLIPAVNVAPGQRIAKRTFAVGPVAIITVYINVIQTDHLCLHKRLRRLHF